MMNFIAILYKKFVDYLNDSSTQTTGSHRGEQHSCGLYSGLSEQEQHDGKY